MYYVDSDCHQDFNLAQLESKAIALPLNQGTPDSLTRATVQEPGVPLEADSESNLTKLASDRQLEQFISNLLKCGVFVSSAIVLIGGILYLIRYGTEPADYRFFLGEPSALCSPQGVVTALLSGSSRGIIQFGILLLIATPVARVAFSLLAFSLRRDFPYVILTLLVMAGLIYSFIGAYV